MAVAKRILVIDDERRMADSVCQLLEREGYSPVAAYGGGEGLTCLEDEHFDIVLTDLRMPDVDGMEVLRRIQSLRPDTLVVVMTGHASTESAIEAIHHRVFDYVPKPFEFDHMLRTVERACQRLETERLRSDMVSMISHDIKVPLTSIIGYTSLIRNRRDGTWHAKAESFLDIIASNANKILALLENYLTTCRIESGRLNLQRTQTQVRDILEELESVLAPEAHKRRITLEFDCPEDLPPVDADENLLYRALANVTHNAMKYSPPGAVVRIAATCVPAEESPLETETLCCTIENPGPGIPCEEIACVFERFRRVDSGAGIEGSGIGLFVVKTVIEAHGGQVHVESDPNQVTRFTLCLPFHEPHTPT